MDKVLEALYSQYQQLLDQQEFVGEDLDYSMLDRHFSLLKKLDVVSSSCISVFDLFRKRHIYISRTFESTLGYDLAEVEEKDSDFFNSRIHPQDFPLLLRNGIHLMKYLLTLPAGERRDYKSITEYRIRNAREEYIKVIEQQQALELDSRGNLWLGLSFLDIAPNQDVESSVKSQLLNFRTGELVPVRPGDEFPFPEEARLSAREKEILSLIRDGHLSKEIAEKLYISVHTVNTHRQRILQKLNADNSMEAIRYASGLGLLS